MKKINILIVTLFLAFTTTLFGQDISTSKIYAAQGNDFVILRDGKRILYNADRLNDGPIAFLQGDIFQTGQQSSADVQFGENGPLLKIVENTSIGFVGHGSGRDMLALNLFYGRIRVRNNDEGTTVQVSSKNGLVEIIRGDAGIDYIVRNDQNSLQSGTSVSSPILYVTNFVGETNVFPANDGNAVSTLPQLLVRERETVSVEFVSSLSYVERNAVGSATADYWRTYDFAPLPSAPTAIVEAPPATPAPTTTVVETAEPVPQTEPVVSTNVEEIPYTLPPVNPDAETIIKRKNSAFLTGLIFLVGGFTLGGIGLYNQSLATPSNNKADLGYFFTVSGMMVAGVGVVTTIHGLTIRLDE
jgi:hypothetical protein